MKHQPCMISRGHTLIEMVMSLTILGIISVSVGSVVMLAAQTTPDEESPTATLIGDSRMLTRLSEDLAMAMYIPERGTNSVTVVVADRTGDGLPDRLRYAWSATAASPLTFELNDQSPVALMEKVDQFVLSYNLESQVATIPAPPAESAYNVATAVDAKDFQIKEEDWVGQTLTPAAIGSETQYQIQRVRFMAKQDGGDSGVISVELQSADGSGLPTGTVLDSVEINESDLAEDYDWYEVAFPNPPTLNIGQSVCFVLRWVSGDNAAIIEYDEQSPSATNSFFRFQTDDGGVTWTKATGESLLIQVDTDAGTTTGYDLTREYVTAIGVTLQSTAEGRSPLMRTVITEQAPEVLTQFWHAGFYGAPTNYDLNNDGSSDWVYNGSPGTNIAVNATSGIWNASADLAIEPVGTLPDVVRVDVRAQATSGDQAKIYGPFHNDGSGNVLPLIAILEEDGSDQQLLIYNEQTPTTPIATITGLSADPVDIQLTLLPNEQVVYFVVDGEERGSAKLAWEADQGLRGFWLDGSGNGSKFLHVRVTYGGSYVENANAPVFPLGGSPESGTGDSGDSGGGTDSGTNN